MSKTILYGYEAREQILKGINKAVDAVEPTLGAVGMSSLIDLGGDFFPNESDDGITVLRNLSFEKRPEQMGMLLVRKASQRTNDEGGDGTSTTASLTRAITNKVHKILGEDDYKIAKTIQELETSLEEVKSWIQWYSKPVEDEDIEKVATIACLDPEIGKIIAETYKEIGRDGIISVEDSNTLGYTKEVVKGVRFKKGFISPYFINDPKGQVVLNEPYVILVDRRVAMNTQIAIFDKILKSGQRDVLMIADNVEGEALASLAVNARSSAINVACVQPPHALEYKRDWLRDMAILTGGTLISEEAGLIIDNVGLEVLGKAEKVVVTKDTTTIVNGYGDKEAIQQRVESLKLRLDDSKSDVEKDVLKERIASLSGGIGVIRVGAITDTELQAKKYKIEDAVNATKSALEEGIVPGGGVCYTMIDKALSKDNILKDVLTAPIKRMAKNAGMNENKIVKQIQNTGLGYDFSTGEMCHVVDKGIIDSAKVTRLAIESAVSVAKTFIRAQTVITE